MKNQIALWIIITLIVGLAGPVAAQLDNPYEILQKHYQALGGFDKIKTQQTLYKEGTVEIVGMGLNGTFKEWRERPVKSREEVNLGIITQTLGDDGATAWMVDHNGQLQIRTDARSLADRRVSQLMYEFDYLNPGSPNFKLAFAGVEPVENANCYVVLITNTINTDTVKFYIDQSSFYLVQQIVYRPDGRWQFRYFDFRDVAGVIMPFLEEFIEYPTAMKQVKVTDKVDVNIPVEASLFAPPEARPDDFRFTTGNSAENIPFQFIENHIYFEVTVAGKKRLWVLDSGAGMSVVEKKFADELGLVSAGSLKGQGTNDLVDIFLTYLPPYSLPGLEFDSQRVAIVDLNWLFHQSSGLEVAGILGYDFLSRLVTKIDYAGKLISFYHPEHFRYDGLGVVVDAPIGSSNTFQLPMTVDGKYSGIWNVDLGASGLSFHYPFAAQNGLLGRGQTTRTAFGAGGKNVKHMARFDSIELAGFVVGEPVIDIPIDMGEGAFATADVTGNLGNTLLRHFVIYLDYLRRQMIFEKGADFGKTFPCDNSGLSVILNDRDELEVGYVAQGSPAVTAGFLEGDIITSIDGESVVQAGGILGFKDKMSAAPGTVCAIEILRQAEPLTLTITLRDLYLE